MIRQIAPLRSNRKQDWTAEYTRTSPPAGETGHGEGDAVRGDYRRGCDLSGALDELIPQAWHHVEQYANNPIESDHGQLKHRLKPMRGLRNDRTAQTIIAGHAFVRNLRRGHYELAIDSPPAARVAETFTALAQAI
ncbi:DDE-type integrase/transposase/recombinase [Micromonospora tulbaghiae]|uniref:DDE-type integrase/transposase/recombinase n=1 Tax=Micromonospora tulbaghiae TaxID=479978 RepID=UPI003EBB1669